MIDLTENDVTVDNLDGSKTETIIETNSNGSLHQKAVVTTSADGCTTTLQEDTAGGGFFNEVETTTVNADGSSVTRAEDLTHAITTVSADGLSSALS